MKDQDNGGILAVAQTEEIRNKFLSPAQRLAKEKQDTEAKLKRDERAREREIARKSQEIYEQIRAGGKEWLAEVT